MKRFLIAAALVAMIASAAYAAPPDKGKPENPGQSNEHKAGENGNSANNPAKACKKERADLGVTAFNTKYGTNHNLKNAFGKCVSGKAKTKTEGKDEAKDDEQSTSNAAKQCKKERIDMGAAAFATKYGTNANKANAFGKCVSSKAKGNGESDDD
jgi:opacity protein-like surface antigen